LGVIETSDFAVFSSNKLLFNPYCAEDKLRVRVLLIYQVKDLMWVRINYHVIRLF